LYALKPDTFPSNYPSTYSYTSGANVCYGGGDTFLLNPPIFALFTSNFLAFNCGFVLE